MADGSRDPGYVASAWTAALITDIDRLGLLEGELRKQIASTVELFRMPGAGGGDPDRWYVDLYDFYEELHRHPPEPR